MITTAVDNAAALGSDISLGVALADYSGEPLSPDRAFCLCLGFEEEAIIIT